MSSRKRKRSKDQEWIKKQTKARSKAIASFTHENFNHSMVISPVLMMEKIIPGPNWKHCIKLEVDGFKKMLVHQTECKMCVI